jgi:membrane peptidoglycan carboxypeptidase
MSLNIPAVKVLYLAGVKNSITLAKSLGITTLNEPDRYGLSLVLGGGEVKLLDHVSAFATIANGGVRQEKISILRIEDAKGNVLERFENNQGTRVVEEKYISALDHILSTNAYRAPVFGENNFLAFKDRAVAGKTGTTNEFRDGWTMGYTPTLAVGVWVGNNDNRPMKPGSDGSIVAAPIWRAFMDEALKNTPAEEFPKYNEEDFKTNKDVLNGELRLKEDVKVCEIPNKKDKYCKANKYCPDDEVKKKDFADVHTILYYVNKDDPQGDTPSDPKNDPQFKEWEKGIKEYYKKDKDYLFGSYPEDDCKEDDFSRYKPSVSISAPDSVNSSSVTISAVVNAPYGTKSIRFFVDNNEIGSNGSQATYTTDSSKTIEARVEVTDNNGNTTKAEKNISISVPPAIP